MGTKVFLTLIAIGFFVAANTYRDYAWLLAAVGVVFLLRAFIFTRRY